MGAIDRLLSVFARHRARFGLALASLAALGAAPPPRELILPADARVTVMVDGEVVRAQVVAGLPNLLILSPQGRARLRLRQEASDDHAYLRLFGRRALAGRARDVQLIVADEARLTEAYWFPQPLIDGPEATLGPLMFGQPRVTFPLDGGDRLGPGGQGGAGGPGGGALARYRFTLVGGVRSVAGTQVRDHDQPFLALFNLEQPRAYPLASAALGAHLARHYGGTLGGPSWDSEILFGIKRPVRWLTLARPVRFGPFALSKLAVRVRDRVDGSGAGGARIREAGEPIDLEEVTVEAARRGPRPIYSLSLPRALLAPCARLTFDKRARQIELVCPAGTRLAAG